MQAYSEVLDLVKNLVIESEVIAGNDIDTSLLLNVPVLQTESLCLSEEVSLGKLAAPVCLSCLFQVTESSHAGETEDGPIADS